MGGSSSQTTNTSSSTSPWAAAIPALTGILGGLAGISTGPTAAATGAINQLEANAQGGNPYTGDISRLTSDLFGGGTDRSGIATDAYNGLLSRLAPTANGDYADPNKNPFFAQTLQSIGNDVTNRLKAEYASAGRTPEGAGSFGGELGSRIAQAAAPLFANQYNTERSNQINAANNLFTGGMQTGGALSGLDQQALANRQAGIGVAGEALNAQNYGPSQTLALELQRQGIPLSILQQLAGIATPIAGLGSQSTGQSTTNKQASGMEQFAQFGSGLANFAKGAATLGPLMFSDRRVKEDVRKIGSLYDGTPVYFFRYIGDPAPQIGLMAQDVEKVRPEAVAEFNGIKMVDYDKATERSRAMVR